MRYILLALFIYIAYRVIKNIRSMSTFTKKTEKKQPTIGEPKELIACSKCGTFIMKSSALRSNSDYYCNEGCMNS